MSELYDRYRLYFMLERKNERNNQFQHTSHLLSENVLTAACPWYYTCKYYNAYVYFCPYIENFPLYLLMKIGSKGRRPARRRVGSGASPAAELPLWSQLIRACPIPLGRLKLIRLKAALHIKKFPQSVDTERGNGYNTYKVRPKRSANI